jgi:hypothetical protein
MQPLWTKGDLRQAPMEEVRLISSFIPDLQREETQKLFPHAPWTPATASGFATNPAAPPRQRPLTKSERQQAIDLDDPDDATVRDPTALKKQRVESEPIAEDPSASI